MYKSMNNIVVVSFALLLLCAKSSGTELIVDGTKEITTRTIKTLHGKSGAPVVLTYDVPSNIVAGSMVQIHLTFSSSTPEGRLRVQLNADDGLEFLSTSDTANFDLADDPMNMDVQVFPNNNGLYYLNVYVEEFSAGDEEKKARAFSVPIQAGLTVQNLKSSGRIIEDGQERIIEMIAN